MKYQFLKFVSIWNLPTFEICQILKLSTFEICQFLKSINIWKFSILIICQHLKNFSLLLQEYGTQHTSCVMSTASSTPCVTHLVTRTSTERSGSYSAHPGVGVGDYRGMDPRRHGPRAFVGELRVTWEGARNISWGTFEAVFLSKYFMFWTNLILENFVM